MIDPDQEAEELFLGMAADPAEGRKNRSWPFSRMQSNSFLRVTEYMDYSKAVGAARQVQRRKGWRFVHKWHGEKGYGIIGRVACILLLLTAPAHAQYESRTFSEKLSDCAADNSCAGAFEQ